MRKMAALLGLLVTYKLGAQEAPEPAKLHEETRSRIGAAVIDPSLRSPVLASLLDLKVEASSKDKTAALSVGHDFGGNGSLHLKLSAPIDTSQDQTELADLRGLRDTATLEMGLKMIFDGAWPKPDSKLGPALDKACKEAGLQESCDVASLPLDVAERFLGWKKYPTLLGLAAQFGKKSFDWTDKATLKKNSETHLAYSVSFAAGVFPLISMRSTSVLRGLYYIGVDGRYEVSYKNAPKTQLCTPLGTGGASTCDEVFLGAPTKKEKVVAELEIRKYFGPNFLANPRFNWDIKNHVEGVELPLYFIKSPKGGLNGGVTLGWRSDTHALTASVFVGEIADIWSK